MKKTEEIDPKRVKKIISSKRVGRQIWKRLSILPKSSDDQLEKNKIQEKRIELEAHIMIFLAVQLTYDRGYSQSELFEFVKKHSHFLRDMIGLILVRESQRRGYIEYFEI